MSGNSELSPQRRLGGGLYAPKKIRARISLFGADGILPRPLYNFSVAGILPDIAIRGVGIVWVHPEANRPLLPL